jgi:hypothetical protein
MELTSANVEGTQMSPTALTLSERVERKLSELASKIRWPKTRQKIWEQLLTDQERRASSPAEFLADDPIAFWIRNRDVSDVRAVLEIARPLWLITEGEYQWLLREAGEAPVTVATPRTTPRWDRATGVLWFGKRKVRRVARLKSNIALILDTFEQQGWPSHIENPLSRGAVQLHDSIRSLNTGLKVVRFHADGAAAGIRWAANTRRSS